MNAENRGNDFPFAKRFTHLSEFFLFPFLFEKKVIVRGPSSFFFNFTHLHELSSLSFILLLWCIDLVDPQHRQSAVRHAIHCRVDKNSNITQYMYYDDLRTYFML